MKAARRRAAGGVLALSLLLAAAADARSGLPEGMPGLPGLSERMLRDGPSGLALRGYDPVAYRLADEAVAGRPDYELALGGLVWRFASEANRAAFRDAPALYMPGYAGFDAGAIADGRVVDADPRRFAIVGGVLYLFRNEESRRRFLSEAAFREQARAAWPALDERLTR